MNRKNKSDNQIHTNEAVETKDSEVTVELGCPGRPRPNLDWPESSDSVGVERGRPGTHLGDLDRSGSAGAERGSPRTNFDGGLERSGSAGAERGSPVTNLAGLERSGSAGVERGSPRTNFDGGLERSESACSDDSLEEGVSVDSFSNSNSDESDVEFSDEYGMMDECIEEQIKQSLKFENRRRE